MKGNFGGRAGITLGIVGSILLMLACAVKGHLLGMWTFLANLALVGIWMFLASLILLVVVVVLISRAHKNDDDLDPLKDAVRTAKFVKSHKTKPVYEHDADIWNQMAQGDQTDTAK